MTAGAGLKLARGWRSKMMSSPVLEVRGRFQGSEKAFGSPEKLPLPISSIMPVPWCAGPMVPHLVFSTNATTLNFLVMRSVCFVSEG